MKALLSTMMLVIGLGSFALGAQAQDNSTNKAQTAAQDTDFPRGGWDGNNLRISAGESNLLAPRKNEGFWGGGWDLNNLRVSATRSQLLDTEQ